MKDETAKFYEYILSDCDGSNATLHVWTNGKVETIHGTPAVRTRLLRAGAGDYEASKWVNDALRRKYPVSFKR